MVAVVGVRAASVVFILLIRRAWLLVPMAAVAALFFTFAPAAYLDRMATITTDPAKMDISSLARYQNVQIGKQIIAQAPPYRAAAVQALGLPRAAAVSRPRAGFLTRFQSKG